MALTSYTDLPNAAVQAGGRPRGSTITALRDNPIAIAEGDTTAVVNSPAWHPYNMVKANDGNTGKFWDFAINGLTTTITTPAFVDGYDYMVRWVGASHNNGAAQSFRVGGAAISGTVSNAVTFTGFLEILMPTLEDYPKGAWIYHRQSALGANGPLTTDDAAAANFHGRFGFTNLATALTSISFDWSAGQFDAGQFFLYRRRNYISG